MSELTLFLIRLAYLAILWIFVLSAISVIRSDMFGARAPAPERGAARATKSKKSTKSPPKRRGSPTHVLVVDGGGSLESALMGDLIAASAVEHGWAGVVINGAVRDVAAIRELPLGALALGSNP